jgi:hypothetical protein
MIQVMFVGSKIEGRTGVQTPYNADFVKELKTKVPSAKWSGKAWFFDDIALDDVKKLVSKYFPQEEQLNTARITWQLHRDDPQIDGISLASINRDYWNWRADCPVQFKVIEADIAAGGSRRSPGLYGNLIIEAKIRPEARITPEPKSVEILENGDTPNPLTGISTEDLFAELERRGELVLKKPDSFL